ncbi:MAG: UDP-N-acetylmuramoyl-L-alanine--D-glutamate ligase [Candidatus Harrisonbacteria bacterium]|nr:UDP-N-acetylmuramoyl-L-alanine--D-glutamate ligase [Candidatus Harrisonbacteria bacterium]
MRTAILGLGREGKSLLNFLKKRGEKPAILDQKLDSEYLNRLNDFDIIYRSPGVPYNLPQIQKALKSGVRFSSATKLFFDLCPGQIVGVTGTKGKGTASTLIHKILAASGQKTFLAGNIGKPMLDVLSKLDKKSTAILELSSFQLQDLEKSPPVAVVLDVFPDHLDVHKNMKEYVEAKSSVTKYQKFSDAVFFFKDNPLSAKIARLSHGAKIGIDGNPFGLKKNLAIAAAVGAYFDCPAGKIFQTIQSFKGREHRLELVSEKNGLRFYNDSASTNPQTAAAAITELSKTLYSKSHTLTLITGGKDKNLNYRPLAQAINRSGKVKVFLFGENKMKIKRVLPKAKLCKNLKETVGLAKKCGPGVILFSPASTSFDMFKDYEDRGRQFKKLVKAI